MEPLYEYTRGVGWTLRPAGRTLNYEQWRKLSDANQEAKCLLCSIAAGYHPMDVLGRLLCELNGTPGLFNV